MSHLIDVDLLMRRVAEHLDLPIDQVKTHFSLPEQIKMLCDALDEKEELIDTLYTEIAKRS